MNPAVVLGDDHMLVRDGVSPWFEDPGRPLRGRRGH